MDAALAQLVREGAIRRDVALERSSTPAELQRLFDGGAMPATTNGRPTWAAV